MKQLQKPIWFGRKKVGIGIRPLHPIGWLLTAVLVVAFVVGTHLIVASSGVTEGLTIIISAAIVYAIAVSLTFE